MGSAGRREKTQNDYITQFMAESKGNESAGVLWTFYVAIDAWRGKRMRFSADFCYAAFSESARGPMIPTTIS